MKPLRAIVEISLKTFKNMQKKMDKWQKSQKQFHQNSDQANKKPLRTIAPTP
jgi:hypothetical protein